MMLKHKRFDVRVQRMAGYRIEVYWRADSLGCGPCMSLYIGSKEKLRFDLFDPPHMHRANVPGSPRQYYPKGLSAAKLGELACADMIRLYPVTARAAGWAAEQLGKVTGPMEPVSARDKRRPTTNPYRRHGARRMPPPAN